MTGEINRVPRGLLSILDMQARGQSPRLLSNELQLGFDIGDLYLIQQRENVVSTVVVSSVGVWGSGAQTTVPQNELWYLWQYTVRPTAALVGAGGAIRFRPLVRSQPNNRTHVYGQRMDTAAVAGFQTAVCLERPMWLSSGDVLGVYVDSYTAFAPDPTMNCEALITRVLV